MMLPDCIHNIPVSMNCEDCIQLDAQQQKLDEYQQVREAVEAQFAERLAGSKERIAMLEAQVSRLNELVTRLELENRALVQAVVNLSDRP